MSKENEVKIEGEEVDQEEVEEQEVEEKGQGKGAKKDSDSDDDGADPANSDPNAKKSNRGEKKFKKAMQKLGMKPITGINRVTIKKGKTVLLYIDDPEILKSPTADNSYIVFGEAKMNDFAQNMAMQEAGKFRSQKPEVSSEKSAVTETVVDKKEDEANFDEEGVDPADITMIMEHCKVTKMEAIKALREADGDKVNAILKLSDK